MKNLSRLIVLIFCAISVGCASTAQTGLVARECGDGSAQTQTLAAFGFKPVPNKVVIFRIFATWCPYCKDDLGALGWRFQKGLLKAEDVQVWLLAYHGTKETRESYEAFKASRLSTFGIPAEAIQIQFVDRDYASLANTPDLENKKIFEGWRGVPFGMLFGKDGRLVFRGHFTQSLGFQNNHYALAENLSHETCR